MVLVPLRPVPVTRTRTPPMSAPRDDSVQDGVLSLVRREAGALLLVHHGEAVTVDETLAEVGGVLEPAVVLAVHLRRLLVLVRPELGGEHVTGARVLADRLEQRLLHVGGDGVQE